MLYEVITKLFVIALIGINSTNSLCCAGLQEPGLINEVILNHIVCDARRVRWFTVHYC